MVNLQLVPEAPATPLQAPATPLPPAWSDTLAASYDALAPAVFGVAVQVTSNEEVAARLTADVFAGLEAVTDEESLAHCVLTDVHRRAVSWVRSQNVTPGLHLHPGALEVLPSNEREVITAAYFCGETYADIASRMKLDPAEVAALMQQGLRRLAAPTAVAVP